MIYTFLIVLMALVLGGGLLFFFGILLDQLVIIMEVEFASIFTGTNWNIIKAVINWRMLLLIIIPTLLWVISNNRGPKER